MSEKEIEDKIRELDLMTRDWCVFPEQQNIDCCDCYTCRVAFFDKVRELLRAGKHLNVIQI